MKRQEGQAGVTWLVLGDKKEPTRKRRRTGFKVVGKTGSVSGNLGEREFAERMVSSSTGCKRAVK